MPGGAARLRVIGAITRRFGSVIGPSLVGSRSLDVVIGISGSWRVSCTWALLALSQCRQPPASRRGDGPNSEGEKGLRKRQRGDRFGLRDVGLEGGLSSSLRGATKQSIFQQAEKWIASRSLSSGRAFARTRWLAMTKSLRHPEKIALADLDAVVAQDAVRGRGVEKEIRKHRAVDVLLARQRHGV